MAIDFPSSPTLGQVYTYNGITYTFTAPGVWASVGGPPGPQGPVGPTDPNALAYAIALG